MKQHSAICGGLVVLTLLAFEPVRHSGFVDFDDRAYVFENDHVLSGLCSESVVWAFSVDSTEQTANWHPLTWLSLMLDVSLFGPDPVGMHLVNVGIHTINVLLLYLVLFAATQRKTSSAVVAALFAVHPLHVESVAWISERKDVLSTMFVLCSLWSYVQWTRQGLRRWHLLALCTFLLSLLAKQMYVTLPALLLLMDDWPLNRNDPPESVASVQNGPSWRALVSEKVGFFAIALLFCAAAVYAQSRGGAVRGLDDFPLLQRILNALIVYVVYLRQAIWPFGLAVYYPYPRGDLWVGAFGALAMMIAVTLFAIWQRRRRPWLLFGWLWYIVTLTPVIGVVQIGHQRMADRYMYFPLIGLLIMAIWSASGALASASKGVRMACAGPAVAGILVLLFATRNQISHWRDTLSLFRHAAAVAPSSLSFGQLAAEYQARGDLDRAAEAAARALEINPKSQTALNILGTVALNQGQPAAAETYFRRETASHPQSATAFYNLGLALSQQNRNEEAVEAYERGLQFSPDRVDIRTNLGAALISIQQHRKAIVELERVLKSSPDLPQANFHYAVALMSLGADDRAIRQFQAVLKSSPNLWQAHLYLARLYHEQTGHLSDARHHAEIAVELSGNAQPARELLRQISEK